ncbi:MAG: phosphate uptake regulator PhoU [Candidatus Bathyarchaeota archaeon]|nr:phosphate uptake regulator PhoU [Candidatus Bathyarchaeota archaeon]
MPETRKLQQIGGTSLYVSLPKDWTRQMQLKQGDQVTLAQQSDGSMAVHPTVVPEKPRQIALEIKAEESGRFLKRRIVAAYVDGFDVIQIEAEKRFREDQHDIIREVTEALFGLEVIEVTSNSITIQCLLTPKLPIEKTFQRIHNVISSMFTETISALREHDINLAKSVSKRIQDVERLRLVIYRTLRGSIVFPGAIQQMEMSLIDSVDYLRILHRVTEIADHVNGIAISVVELGEETVPDDIQERICETSGFIRNLYDKSVTALLDQDIQLANETLDSTLNFEKLWSLCRKADEKSEISSMALLYAYLLIDNLKEIHRYTTEIAEITIERVEGNMRKE